MPGQLKRHQRRSPHAVRLGVCVREARVARGFTQEVLAERASLSKNYVGNVERGEYDVTVEALRRIANAVGRTAAEILAAARM